MAKDDFRREVLVHSKEVLIENLLCVKSKIKGRKRS